MSNLVTPPFCFCELFHKTGGNVRLENFYRVYLGKRQGQQVWIVDGAKVVSELYPSFIMGGNDQRYRFNPNGDIWLDNRIGAIELGYTLGHELIERKLMRTKGWTYDKAHAQGLALELKMRAADQRMVEYKQDEVDPVVGAVYRSFYKTVEGMAVWMVDGPTVRATLDGDFCFVASDLEYDFIPKKEIWLDTTQSIETVHYSVLHELERRRISRTKRRDDAYEGALAKQIAEYAYQANLAKNHEASLAPVQYGNRARGVKPGRKRRKS